MFCLLEGMTGTEKRNVNSSESSAQMKDPLDQRAGVCAFRGQFSFEQSFHLSSSTMVQLSLLLLTVKQR